MDIDKLRNGKGQTLYRRAKTLIPGGTQLLSKRPEMFLPEYWPAYFRKAKGIGQLEDGQKRGVGIWTIWSGETDRVTRDRKLVPVSVP